MKKMLKDNKGFTLIELLAVIVVLAVIMVIATQQVNATIRKSRARSYFDNIVSIKKAAKLACAESTLSQSSLDSVLDKTNDSIATVDGNNVIVTAPGESKFKNMDLDELKNQSATGIDFSAATADNSYKVTITDPCEQD